MMKKIYFGIFVAAVAMFAAACSNDDLETIGNEPAAQPDETATVSFSLTLDDQVQTRSTISDGTSIDKLYYVIFNSENTNIAAAEDGTIAYTTVDFTSSTTATINAELVNNQSYTAVFWAQNADCGAYTLSIDETSKNVTVGISYDSAKNNDETRDAFYGVSDTFTVGSDSGTQAVTLQRPFAQINIGATTDGLSGYTISESSVTISNVATSLNLQTGEASADTTPTSATFASAAVPTESLIIGATDESTGTSYTWLSMTYVLIPDEQTTVDVEFTAGTVISSSFTDIPVQSNYRTNILGVTVSSDVTITADNLTFDETGVATASVDANTTSYSFNITSDSEWTVTSDNEDFTISTAAQTATTSSSGNATVTVTFPANKATSEVTANITIKTSSTTRTIQLVQAAAVYYYEKVTAEQTDWSGQYLIVYEDGPYAFDGSLSSSSTLGGSNNYQVVTLTDSGIQSTEAVDAISFTIAAVDESYTIQSASGYYIGKTSSGSGLNANTSTVYTNTLSYDTTTNCPIITCESELTLQVYISGENVYFRYYTAGNRNPIALYKLVKE